MTMTERAMTWLSNRGLDVELAVRMGWDSARRGHGEALVIPTYRQDRIVARKYRLFDKPDQKWSSEGESCFWNEDVLRDRSLDGQPLIITEGQFDALTAIQCGFLRTMSVPHGAPPKTEQEKNLSESARYKFVSDLVPTLDHERFPEIILATDNDGPGAQLLQDLSELLGRHRCKFISYAPTNLDEDRPAKDLNELFERDGLAGVVGAIQRARFLALPGLSLISEMENLPAETVYEIGSEERGFRLLADNYKMRLGDLAVVTGVPGLGKSTFLNDVCCRVAFHYGVRIAWASFEQRPQTDHRRSLRAWFKATTDDFSDNSQADAWIDKHHVFITASQDVDPTLDWLLDKMEAAVTRYRSKIIVIDPWNEIEHRRSVGESETEYIGAALRTFKRFAAKFQVHVILVAHPAKMQKVNGKYLIPSLYDIAGSANFYNKVDVGIIVHREDRDTTVIKVQKVRYQDSIGRPGEVAMGFNLSTRRYTENERLA